MKKISKKPAPLIYPVPAAMVSCGSSPEDFNIITIAWTGTINSDPAMCYISKRKTFACNYCKKYGICDKLLNKRFSKSC